MQRDDTKGGLPSRRPNKTVVNLPRFRDYPSALQVQRLNFVHFLEFIRESDTINNNMRCSIKLHLLCALHDVKERQSPVQGRE